MGPRRMAAWLVSIPLMVVSSQGAHLLAYRWVYPSAHLRLNELLGTGHSYMVGTPAYLPLLLALIGAVELVVVTWLVAGSFRRSLRRPAPAWTFALLPLLGFTLQELFERLLAGASFPWWIVLQPTFRVGLLLQLPFALVAYLVARLLLRVAERVGDALRRRAPAPQPLDAALRWVVSEATASPLAPLAGGHASRGPPATAAAALPACR
ncbi:MAG: hypothetical protein JO156_01590 [Solirubrobacterales bacterium]|nr:hypothetical protein [Solirubrobacterales bacterium]